MSLWFWVGGIGVIVAVFAGFSLYSSHLEDEGYWVPNSMKDLAFAVAVILLLALIALPKILEVLGD